jgi:hypothetical protein
LFVWRDIFHCRFKKTYILINNDTLNHYRYCLLKLSTAQIPSLDEYIKITVFIYFFKYKYLNNIYLYNIIMSCDIKYDDIIFAVQKKSRFNNTKHYVFIGTTENIITVILNKLEKRQSITKDEVVLLKQNYPNDYLEWINIVKKNIVINFIPHKIQIDDSISDIREKIFIYLSDETKQKYILPQNQELWLYNNDTKKEEIIGYYYEDIKTKDKKFSIPHLSDYDKFDKNNIKPLNFTIIKKNISENNILIYDLINTTNYLKNIIYLSDAKEEEEYLKNNKINITQNIIDNYFKKYWPYVNLEYNKGEIKNNYFLLKDYFLKETYIRALFKQIPYNTNNFGSYKIITIKIIVNDSLEFNNINNVNNYDDYNNEYLDLFTIFDYLKEEKIDKNTPFLKYNEDTLDSPFALISKDAINNNFITKKNIEDWIGIDKPTRRMNAIQIKRIYDIKKYSSISLSKFGKIMIHTSFSTDVLSNFNDVNNCIKDAKYLLEDINKNRIIKKKNEIHKLSVPDINIKDNFITLKPNTKIIYMNITIPLKFNYTIDFKKLSDFSKQFPYFLAEIPKNISEQKEYKNDTSIKLKYKRISSFANMNDILSEIDILKQKYDKDTTIIIKILEKKYQKSIDEIKSYLLEWEKKYSSKSSKVSSLFRSGILVTISNNNILINGITKIYQIPLVYNFFVMFLTLFINYDTFYNNKEFKKFFKTINSNEKLYLNDYEIDINKKIDLHQIYEYNDYDDMLYHKLEEYDEEIDEMYQIDNIEDVENINSLYKSKIVGIAKDEDIGKDIKLVCEDAVPEKDTCEDFCNDQNYFLRRLQRYDNKLFKFNIDKNKDKQYSRGCQQYIKQPVILPYDPATNSNINKDSYTYSVKYSSDPNVFQRWYVCPKIWCPYCEIPIAEADINPKTIRTRATKEQGGVCKTAICPNGDHQVFIREKDSEQYLFPGFLDSSKHPNGLCLPCCFTKSRQDPKLKAYKSFKKCIGDDINNEVVKDGQIYILGKGVPIDNNRYGKLPLEIARLLKTDLNTGYIGMNSGYLRKGIKHTPKNSFLNAICDILSCDKINLKIDLDKIKNILIEKLNNELFLSLHAGNLQNIFHNPTSNLSALDNFKKYLAHKEIEINHIYLWDYLQRNNILFEDGINIFIFENNNLLCPKSENINYFYDSSKKSILLLKSKDFYEPIYFLEGAGKTAKVTCIFPHIKEEIKKLFDISFDGCKTYFDINWLNVLKTNIKKYDLNIDNNVINNEYTLQYTIDELTKLNSTFNPILQYTDTYNKVFGLKLNNGLYLPVAPSKMNDTIKYKLLLDVSDIDKINIKDIIKYTDNISENTNLKCKITHKVLDLKYKKNIIALVNENNRFIPVNKTPSDEYSTIKISNLNYYSDIDESLHNKIQKYDNRIKQINRKNFEDETFIRMRFELSKFLQIKNNTHYLTKINDVIYGDDKNIINNRKKIITILNEIFKILVVKNKNNNDYFDYKTPNKRFPCFLRTSDNNTKLGCNNDPHCILSKDDCKLLINTENILDIHKKFDNYNYYTAQIVDELLRFKMKREEILNDNIPTIINKNFIDKNNDKYIIIHTLNTVEIGNIIDKLFLDTKGLYIDYRNLYENITTKEIAFKKSDYIKSDLSLLYNKNSNIESLSIFWTKLLGNKFKIKLSENNSLLMLISQILQTLNINKSIDVIKKNINSQEESESDLIILSKLYNINIVLLDKRGKGDKSRYQLFSSNNPKLDKYVLLYKSIIYEKNIYNIIYSKNKIVFKINELPEKFVNFIL